MKDEEKSREELIAELQSLRTQVALLEKKKQEEPLPARIVVDHANIAIYRVGEAGEIVSPNEEACRLLGYTREELSRLNITDVDPAVTPESWRSNFEELLVSGVKVFETKQRRKDGSLVPVHIHSKLLEFRGIHYAVAFIQDITLRRQIEKELRDSEKRLNNMVSNIPGVVYQFTAEPRLFTSVIREKALEILGMDSSPEDFFNVFVARLPEEDRERFLSSVDEAVSRVRPWHYEGRFNKTPEEEIWLECNSIPKIVDNRTVFYGLMMDITGRKEMESSSQLKQFIFDKAPVGIWRMGMEGQVLDVNEQACISLGYSKEELLKMTLFELIPGYSKNEMNSINRKLETEGFVTIDSFHRCKNGEILPVQVLVWLMSFQNQWFRVAFVQDISERKRIEEELRESRERLDLALSSSNEGIWDWNLAEEKVYFDSRYYTIAGYEPGEFPEVYEEWEKRIHENDVDACRTGIQRYVSGEQKDFEVEFRFLRKEGTWMWIQAKGKIVSRDDDGNPVRFIGTHADITRQKQAEIALKENEELLANILESMSEGVLVLDTDFRHTVFNKKLEELTNTSRDRVIGKRPWEIFPTMRDSSVEKNMRKAMAGHVVGNVEIHMTLPGRSSAWFRDNFAPLLDSDGNISGIVGVISEITQQIRNEEEMRRLRNYLSNTINSMPSILIGVDEEGIVTLWNNRTEEATGLSSEEALDRPLIQVFPRLSDEMGTINTAVTTQEIKSVTGSYRNQCNEIFYEDVIIYPLISDDIKGAVIRIDDITEKVRLEETLIQSEKMLSVGGLAAGMAHEINNPLSGILQTAGVMERRLGKELNLPANRKAAEEAGTTVEALVKYMDSRGIPRMISTIAESGKRVSEVVRNMLSFARKGEAMFSSHSIEELLDKTLELAATDYDLKKRYDFKKIRITREYNCRSALIPCEASKIQQVFLNIFRNGAEAMAEKGHDDPKFIIRTDLEKDNSMVRIEIADNGPGMDEATRKRVFEPFFTTKPVGVGTGLGLSVSYFIITENHRGEMQVKSIPAREPVLLFFFRSRGNR